MDKKIGKACDLWKCINKPPTRLSLLKTLGITVIIMIVFWLILNKLVSMDIRPANYWQTQILESGNYVPEGPERHWFIKALLKFVVFVAVGVTAIYGYYKMARIVAIDHGLKKCIPPISLTIIAYFFCFFIPLVSSGDSDPLIIMGSEANHEYLKLLLFGVVLACINVIYLQLRKVELGYAIVMAVLASLAGIGLSIVSAIILLILATYIVLLVTGKVALKGATSSTPKIKYSCSNCGRELLSMSDTCPYCNATTRCK